MLLLLVHASCSVQVKAAPVPDSVQRGFSKLAGRYHSGLISDSAYLGQCSQYASSLLAAGVFLSDRELSQQLQLFRAIAWGEERYKGFKNRYYTMLANQAQMAGRGGAMLYYAEKLENIDKQGKHAPIAALTIKADFYRERKAYNKVKKLYLEQKSHFAAISENRELEAKNLVQAMIYLEKTNEAIAQLQDTVTSSEIYTLMSRIAKAIKARGSEDPIYDAYAAYCMARALNYKAIAGKNTPMRDEAIAQLGQLQLKPETPEPLKAYARQTFIEMKIAYYADMQQADSLSYWLDAYESRSNTGTDYDTRQYIKSKRAKACLLNGDTAAGLALLYEAADLAEKYRGEMLQDIDGMLYAHADAEEKELELAVSANKVKQRTLLVIIVCCLFACILIGLQVYFYRSRKVLRKRIRQLGNTVDLQVGLLEEFKLIARQEEQQRISRELHDEWSPGLASALHQVGFIAQDTTDERIKPTLDHLKEQLSYTYNSLRNFSHRLYHVQDGVADHLFENRIRDIINQAFPSSHFAKNVLIADGTMMYINLDARIEVLRIIQESVINIIRHAAAKEVTVLLYEESGNITLSIVDNGKGFDVKASLSQPRRKGMGLPSIKDRSRALKGTLTIESGKGGTSVTVIFPAGSHGPEE
ncbi:MAG TPA: ATP-binding protein [Chitinophagaceae bacterium]|nr:ATP-binding protein [Chitinophagaceae bacterium]